MGVKSTRSLIRKDAEELYTNLKAREMHRQLLAVAVSMLDKELEDELERINDKLNDGEGFENYLIIKEY